MRGIASALFLVAIVFPLYGCAAENRSGSIISEEEPVIPDDQAGNHFASDTPAFGSSAGSSGAGGAASMIPFFTYQGRRYTAASNYRVNEVPAIRELIGEKVGYAPGNINEQSGRGEYAVELSGSISGDVYTVNGYSEQFRLCTVSGNVVIFFEAFNSDEMVYGSDLFGDCLQLADKWEQVKYVAHSQWDTTHPSEYVYRDLQSVSEEDVLSFLTELYASGFENIYESTERGGFYATNNQAHLYFFQDDNTRIDLRMIQGGYVGYEHFIWHFVKMPGEAFNVMFNACQ